MEAAGERWSESKNLLLRLQTSRDAATGRLPYSQVTFLAVGAPAEEVLKVLARRLRALFQHVARDHVLSGRSGQRESCLG